MRKKTTKWIRRAGPASFRPARAQFPSARALGILPDCGEFSRHAPWASTIAAKFAAREDRRGVPRPSLIDLALPERLSILSKYFHTRLVQHHHQTLHNSVKNMVICQLFSKSEGERHFGGRETAEEKSPAYRSFHPTDSPVYVTKYVPPTLLRPLKNQRARVESSATEKGSPFSFSVARRVSPPADRRLRARMEYVEDLPGKELVMRIARQNRRKEFAPPGMTRELAPDFSILPTSRPPLAIGQTFTPSSGGRKRRESAYGETPNAGPHAQSINVPQLADEVMKQLDRRLMAARERMGRI
jgi:hypothetical protein